MDTTLETINESVGELRRTIDQVEVKGRKNVFDDTKFEKLNVVLQAWDDQAQEIKTLEGIRENHETAVAELTELKERRNEDIVNGAALKDQLHQLELEVARGGHRGDPDNFKTGEEYKAFNEYCRVGEVKLAEEHKAVLRTDSAVDGGVLTTVELDSEIVKKITELDGIRAIARVRSTGAKTLDIAIRNTIPVAVFEGEAETGTDSNATYQKETVTPYRQTYTAAITLDQLRDSAFDMDSEISQDAGEAFAFGEGNGHVAGTGFKQPSGFATNATLQAAARDTGTASVVDADDVILLTGDLKAGYNPSYVLNRRTLAVLRTLKASTGMFLWQPGMNGPVANTLNGFSYTIANSMEDIADNAFPIAFGDFRRGYTIVDRAGFSVIRDEFARKRDAIIEFTMNRWTTGQVTLPEALKLLKVIA